MGSLNVDGIPVSIDGCRRGFGSHPVGNISRYAGTYHDRKLLRIEEDDNGEPELAEVPVFIDVAVDDKIAVLDKWDFE